MTKDESATRRKTNANINEVTRPNRYTVWKKAKTSVHPLSAETKPASGTPTRRTSPWFPQSLESLTGLSGSFQQGQQTRNNAASCPGQLRLDNVQHRSSSPSIAATQPTQLEQRFRVEVWLQAFQTLSILLPNTCACIAAVWMSNYWCSFGNVFSGRSPAKQSDFEFFAGAALTGHFCFYLIILATHTHVLLPMQFVCLQSAGNPHASVFFCFRRLFRRTFMAFVVSVLLLGAVFAACQYASASIKDWKLEYYACALLTHVYNSSVTIAVRRIFRQETVHGQMRFPRSRSMSIWSSSVLFIKVYVGTSAKMFLGVFAGAYVQLASGHKITGSWDFAAYSLGSLVLKMAIKGLTRVGLTKLNVKDPRSIFVAAGLPTVLIDTQVRVTLQRSQSANYTIVWTIGMAVFEIVSRMTTVYVTRRQIRCREIAMRQAELIAPATPSAAVVLNSNSPSDVSSTRTTSVAGSPAADFEKWRRQILAFQIAESYANMSAEYIAMGCSTSILFFYWNHPKYELSGHHATGNDSASASASASWSLGYTICAQTAVEVFVDFASCALEISEGVDFQVIRKYRGFLGLLFTSIALMNIQICALIYFNDR